MDDSARLHVAWVGTRLPCPPADGGRQVAWLTIRALTDAGARVTIVTPAGGDGPEIEGVTFVPVQQSARSWPLATIHADEWTGWDALHAGWDTRRVNHCVQFMDKGVCTNQAESYF